MAVRSSKTDDLHQLAALPLREFAGRMGTISALGADEDLVDHGDRSVASDPEQDDFARNDAKGR